MSTTEFYPESKAFSASEKKIPEKCGEDSLPVHKS